MNLSGYKRAIQSLWDGRATVTVREGVYNPSNGRTEPREVDKVTDALCRISFDSVKSTEAYESAATASQTITLFIDPSVDIPEGSKITVIQNGAAGVYERSGKPAMYSCHQQVPLELFKGWA